MDVGLELRQARERRGLTLEQISHTTKISRPVLQALEASDESRLYAPVFTRSFLRAYAREVGLDPDDIVRRYLEQFAAPEAPAHAEEAADAPAGPQPPRNEPEPPRPALRIVRRPGAAALLLLLGLASLAAVAKNYRHANADATQTGAAQAVSTAGFVPVGNPQPPPAATSGTTPTAGATPKAIDPLHITITPIGPCWVEATADGQPAFADLLDAGDRREVETRKDMTLKVGDPATFAFSINGTPARIRGPRGKVMTVQVTRENYRTFLKR
jgi:hypothetical protein